MNFSSAGLQARSDLLDAAHAEVLALPDETAGCEDIMASIAFARQMLATGHVKATHGVVRDVIALLERETRPTANLRRLSEIAHNTP